MVFIPPVAPIVFSILQSKERLANHENEQWFSKWFKSLKRGGFPAIVVNEFSRVQILDIIDWLRMEVLYSSRNFSINEKTSIYEYFDVNFRHAIKRSMSPDDVKPYTDTLDNILRILKDRK